ncbi:potassium-transporting ATPase subunit KdpA [Tundrisphaera lichenicola]|uniref:potassium-transporting ATPase subunit KdpA n=1 Tax=Tundrisphaera lichenicola TaxID=2029860 RepID=UPI003EBEB3A1
MTSSSIIQLGLFFLALALCVKPLGLFMARVYEARPSSSVRFFSTLERIVYRSAGIDPEAEMTWQEYARALLAFSMVGVLAVYAFQRLQAFLPLNPEGFSAVSADSAFNSAVSFATNTNWQGYGGESTMSYLTQMGALGVQNFVSAAAGMAVLVALIRGFARRNSPTIGNFWVDLTRGVFYILLPISFVFALVLVSEGVVQTIAPYPKATLMEPAPTPEGGSLASQTIALGPAASQVAIKQLGTNGGGFFNANSAHPLENPTPLSNLLQVVAILLIPAALCFTFGEMVGDRRQGWAILAAMTVVLTATLILALNSECRGNPALEAMGVEKSSGGNMEGKEVRFGAANSALWAVATTAASNGSVNSMHDSYLPLGGLAAMWLMQLGEVIFGGVGSGLYGMLAFAVLAVFLAGLMVGRTPEYLGKKIGAFEMKMASLVILLPCGSVLLGTAIAVSLPGGRAAVLNPGPHGFSEILYAFSSASNNNGSAFAGLGANTVFYNGLLGLAMLIGRFGVMIPILAMAGSLASKRHVPVGPGTLPTHTPLFIALLVAVVVVVGALSFFPALALGPIVEQLMLRS